MPNFNIVVESQIKESFRVAALRGLFDVPFLNKNRHEWQVDLPIEDIKWNIGLIVGASGSGKTTIGKRLFGEKFYHTGFKWSADKSILDCFPDKIKIEEITNLLSHVGFSSPPSWTKPFNILSNGQKFRVELARILAEGRDLVVIDEFTSTIDRTAAKIGSVALSKTIKRRNKKIVCLSCHKDIVKWLEPDWIYDLDFKKFLRRKLWRPKIKIQLFRTDYKTWSLFKDNHYLTAQINISARCYIAFWNDNPVAFTSCIPMITLKKTFREHRTVVLPDYQGVGIGIRVSEALGELLAEEGYKFRSTTSHPVFIKSRLKSSKWRLVKNPCRGSKKMSWSKSGHDNRNRLTCSFEFKSETDKLF